MFCFACWITWALNPTDGKSAHTLSELPRIKMMRCGRVKMDDGKEGTIFRCSECDRYSIIFDYMVDMVETDTIIGVR